MSLKKRGEIYHWHEWINGVEYRESLKTTDRNEAKRIRQERITEIKTGKGGKLSRQHFSAAMDAFLESRKLHVEHRTYLNEKDRANPLKNFFQEIPLRRITADMIRDYQVHRKATMKTVKLKDGTKEKQPLSNTTVNIEVGLLRRVLKRYKLWTRVVDAVEMLPEGSNIGRALEPEQRKKLVETASTKSSWQAAYCAAVLALNTTMRSAEIEGLQWQRVDLFNQTLMVSRKTTKTDAGERLIPLNRDAVAILGVMWDRALKVAKEKSIEVKPEHYVFCACENYKSDLSKPMKSWRTAWRSLTKKAGLRGLRFHDLRHSAVTALAESGASDQTIMSLAGHVSRKMLEHYSHIRLDAKRKAVESLQAPLAQAATPTTEPMEIRPN